jgi:hypothetical protein
MSNIFEICSVIVVISFTSVMAVGSFAVVCAILMVLVGKDKD